MKIHIYILLAILSVGCAAKKTTSGTKVKPKPSATATAKNKSATKAKTITKSKASSSATARKKATTKAKTVTKKTPPKPAPPVITKEETTSKQKVLETVPLAAPDSDFKKR